MKFKKKFFLIQTITAILFTILLMINTTVSTMARCGNIPYAAQKPSDKTDNTNGMAADLPDAPYTTSAASVVIDAKTGQVLYENNAYRRLYPASITKILTALVALEKGDYDSVITMSEAAVWGIEAGSSNIALDVGEQIRFEDAMYAMMIESANEASLGIAEQVSGSIEAFCDVMNKKAKDLGCMDTHFTNSNGLHDDNHYTTPYDMALITREAIKNPDFLKLASIMEYTIPPTNKNTERVLHQENRMLLDWSDYYYPYCKGGKTGFTDQAGGTLVTWSEKNGITLICVDMFTPSNVENYANSIALFDYCFNNFEQLTPLTDFTFSDEQKTQAESCLNEHYKSANTGMIELNTDTSISMMLPKGYDKDSIVKKLSFDAANADDGQIGKISIEYKGQECMSVPITYSGYVSTQNTEATETFTNQNTDFKPKKNFLIRIIIILFLFGIAGIYIRTRYVKRQRELYRLRREKLRQGNRPN